MIGLLIKSKGNPMKMRAGIANVLFGDAVGYGASLGGFIAVFETAMRVARYSGGFAKDVSLRTLLAGSVAGLSLFAMPASSRTSISIFFLVRAIEVVVRYIHLRRPKLFPTFVTDNAAVLTMGVASAQTVWAWVIARHSMEASYAHFYDHHGQLIRCKTDSITHLFSGPSVAYPPSKLQSLNEALRKVGDHREKLGLPREVNIHDKHVQCAILHPQYASCFVSFGHFIVEGMKRAIPVYLPVYLIPLLLFKANAIVKRPWKTLKGIVSSVLRSSAFLATYCAVAMHALCFFNRASGGGKSHLMMAAAGFVGGTAGLLIERDGRRIELALYVLSHAILSAYRVWHAKGFIPEIPNANVLIFSGSVATLMWAYVAHPAVIRYSYFSLFRFLFGSGGRVERFVHEKGMSMKHTPASVRRMHAPSTADQDM